MQALGNLEPGIFEQILASGPSVTLLGLVVVVGIRASQIHHIRSEGGNSVILDFEQMISPINPTLIRILQQSLHTTALTLIQLSEDMCTLLCLGYLPIAWRNAKKKKKKKTRTEVCL